MTIIFRSALMNVREIECKSILSDSGIYGVDYSINPYRGCAHGCSYCYARFMEKFTDHEDSWGNFVDVKINARKALEDDLFKKEKGSVLLSSVTDPYQKIEEKYQLTRNILSRLANTKFPVNILTKSDLILRDIDVLRQFNSERISVGFTINFLDEEDRKIWEDKAPKIEDRLEALKEISERGINCYVHVGPHLNGITDLQEILKKTEEYIEEFQIENISLKDSREKILKNIEKFYPDLEDDYLKLVEDADSERLRLRERVREVKKSSSVPVKLFLD